MKGFFLPLFLIIYSWYVHMKYLTWIRDLKLKLRLAEICRHELYALK